MFFIDMGLQDHVLARSAQHGLWWLTLGGVGPPDLDRGQVGQYALELQGTETGGPLVGGVLVDPEAVLLLQCARHRVTLQRHNNNVYKHPCSNECRNAGAQ